MASPLVVGRIFNATKILNIYRSSAFECLYKLHSYSTLTNTNVNDSPIKYSKSEASKLTINETLSLDVDNKEKLWYEKYVILGSTIVFLIYFAVLRKENDLDEMLKGNPEYLNDSANLVQLQLKLSYCKKNNLPTQKLEQKIEELKSRIQN